MFSGLRSRCRILSECAAPTAESTCVMIAAVRAGGERPLLIEHLGERATFEQLHRDVEHAVGLFAEVEDARRVRVIEPRRGARLGVEAHHELGIVTQLVGQNLERDELVEGDLLGAIHDAHRALPDDGLDGVLPADATDEARSPRLKGCLARFAFHFLLLESLAQRVQ